MSSTVEAECKRPPNRAPTYAPVPPEGFLTIVCSHTEGNKQPACQARDAETLVPQGFADLPSLALLRAPALPRDVGEQTPQRVQ